MACQRQGTGQAFPSLSVSPQEPTRANLNSLSLPFHRVSCPPLPLLAVVLVASVYILQPTTRVDRSSGIFRFSSDVPFCDCITLQWKIQRTKLERCFTFNPLTAVTKLSQVPGFTSPTIVVEHGKRLLPRDASSFAPSIELNFVWNRDRTHSAGG